MVICRRVGTATWKNVGPYVCVPGRLPAMKHRDSFVLFLATAFYLLKKTACGFLTQNILLPIPNGKAVTLSPKKWTNCNAWRSSKRYCHLYPKRIYAPTWRCSGEEHKCVSVLLSISEALLTKAVSPTTKRCLGTVWHTLCNKQSPTFHMTLD